MAKRYTRAEVLERLRQKVKAGEAIRMFGAGTGLTARCAELGGADLIGIYSTAFYRMAARPSLLAWLPYADANTHTAEMAKAILPAVRETPCIVGIGAHDPGLDLERWIDEMMAMGFSGVTNEPFVGLYGTDFATQLEAAGIGFSKEAELIALAHSKDIFTLGWAFNPDEAQKMARAGANIVGAIVGVTTGGLTGAKESLSLEEATEQVQAICLAAHSVNPDVMLLTHGGPFKDAESAEYSITHSDAIGYASGSSGERIPTEQAVVEITRQYKTMKTMKP